MSDHDHLEGHVYDGIEELDNRLPTWWLATFYGAIVFSVLYAGYYVFGPGPSIEQEWNADQFHHEFVVNGTGRKDKGPDEAALVAVMKDPERQKKGKEAYDAKCAACHGMQGQGGIGPNLTDDNWLHGAKPIQIIATVTNGVGDKGMPAWGTLMTPDDVQSVTAYIKSLRGTNPPNAKGPQGELVKE